jgi:hypothetical protein
VLRPERLYLAQSGPTHAFFVNAQGVQQQHDPQLAGRGLGLSRTISLRYLQFELQPGDFCLLSGRPSPGWTPALLGAGRSQTLEALRRQLIDQVGVDSQAVLVQARPGNGKLRLARPRLATPGQAAASAPAGDGDVDVEAALPVLPQAGGPSGSPLELVQPAPPPRQLPPQPQAVKAPEPAAETAPGQPAPAAAPFDGLPVPASRRPGAAQPASPPVATPDPAEPAPARPAAPRPALPNPAPALLTIGRAFGDAGQQAQKSLRALLRRLLPDESWLELPSSVMAFIAVAVPLVVVAIASTVYFQRGQTSLFDVTFQEAQTLADQAAGQESLEGQRSLWGQALAVLDQAEAYQVNEETQALRFAIHQALDQVDGIERLDYQPAIIGGLAPAIRISRVVSTGDDLYLLDEPSGQALHARRTARGYEMDSTFRCGPGDSIGALVDIQALPRENAYQAALLGMDSAGNVLYCAPEKEPLPAALPTPDSNWGAPRAFDLGSSGLYLLDPQTNAVWIFPSGDGAYTDRPRFFFDEQVPNLTRAVGMAVNAADLYVLHDDSHLTTCVYSTLQEAPTRCEDPAVFSDSRPGRQPGPQIANTSFSQILYIPPPDPSIYLLDPQSRAIYHFSVRLNLQRQLQALQALPEGAATAFTIGPDRTVFLALGNQVFYAILP